MKNDIVHMSFLRKDEIVHAINDIATKIKTELDEILCINQGGGEITIIFDKKNKQLFSSLIKKAIEIRENVAILSIIETKQKGIPPSIDVQGVYAYFINQISRKSINILDIISTHTQITFVLDEKDLVRAYSVISDCIKHFRE